MNTFEKLIGRQITKVYRVDSDEPYKYAAPLAIFLELGEEGGLLVGQDVEHETTTISFMTLEDVQYDYGTNYYENCLNEPRLSDKLSTLEGQIIKSIKVGEFTKEKSVGDGFTIKQGQYAGVILEIGSQKVTIFIDGNGTQILFDSDLLFPESERWTLT